MSVFFSQGTRFTLIADCLASSSFALLLLAYLLTLEASFDAPRRCSVFCRLGVVCDLCEANDTACKKIRQPQEQTLAPCYLPPFGLPLLAPLLRFLLII